MRLWHPRHDSQEVCHCIKPGVNPQHAKETDESTENA